MALSQAAQESLEEARAALEAWYEARVAQDAQDVAVLEAITTETSEAADEGLDACTDEASSTISAYLEYSWE